MAIKDYLSKQEWQAQRLANEVASGIIEATPNVKAFIDAHAPTFGKRAAVPAPNEPAKTKHVPKARRWSGIPGGSDCFDDASYDGRGTLTLSFIGPKAGVYDYDVDDDEARDARQAARDGVLGEWFNEEIK